MPLQSNYLLPMTTNKKPNWSIKDEMIYLTDIGKAHLQTRNRQEETLKGYLIGLGKRENMDGMDKVRLRARAESLLAKL